MNVVIRTDASLEIGTGHVMRCLTLAKQLIIEGFEVSFICCDFQGNSISYIQEQGFRVYNISSQEENNSWKWIKDNWRQDVEDTKQIIKEINKKIDLLIVDHYSLDVNWEKELREAVKHIMVIDDLADRSHDCDILLDQNYYLNLHNRYKGLVSASCIQLLGPDYVLLRDEFLSINVKKIKRDGNLKRILVFFGGTDLTGETIKTLQAISELNHSEIEFDVVVGESNPHKEKIEQQCNDLLNVTFHCQVSNMAELMLDANLAIGAGGSTTWERCFLKLPSITIILAENQRDIALDVARRGASLCIGDSNHISSMDIKTELMRLINTPNKVDEMATNCLNILNPEKVKGYETVKRIRNLIM